MAVARAVEHRTLTCDKIRMSGRGGAESIQDVRTFLRCCSHPDGVSVIASALTLKMAHTDKCGNVTNVKGFTATPRRTMDVVDWCFQQAKRTWRRQRSRPEHKLPERLVYTDDLGKTVLDKLARYEELLGSSTLGGGVVNSRVLRRRADSRRIQWSDGLEHSLVHLLP